MSGGRRDPRAIAVVVATLMVVVAAAAWTRDWLPRDSEAPRAGEAPAPAESASPVSALDPQLPAPRPELVLVIRSATRPHTGETNFARLADFYGLDVATADVAAKPLDRSIFHGVGNETYKGIYIHAETLQSLDEANASELASAIRQGAALYVDASTPDGGPRRTEYAKLAELTEGAIRGVNAPGSVVSEWRVASDLPAFTRQFAGQAVRATASKQADREVLLDAGKVQVLIEARNAAQYVYPVVVRYVLDKGSVIVDAGRHEKALGDAPQGMPLYLLFQPATFSAVAPAMMFLNFAFGDAVLHRDRTYANFTIDDPALRNPYGRLDFFALLSEMKRDRFHTTIAYVPASFGASDQDVVHLFRQNAQYYSLAIHGDNHNDAECNKTLDASGWERVMAEGLTRMSDLERRTGLPFDPVMVFPCGITNLNNLEVFSMLKKYNFLGTVNASLVPGNAVAPRIPDFGMRPADLAFGNEPAMQRSAPLTNTDVPDQLATRALFNAFVGRPALLYTHQDFFASGAGAFGPFARAVNAALPGVEWRGLGEIMRRAYLWKRNPDASISVLMYANELVLENPDGAPRTMLIERPESGSRPIETVEANGMRVPFRVVDGRLRLALAFTPHGTATIRVRYGQDVTFRLNGLRFDPAEQVLAAEVCNVGKDAGPVSVAAFDGPPQTAARTVVSTLVWPQPSACEDALLRLGALRAGSHTLSVEVDPYGVVSARPSMESLRTIDVQVSGIIAVEDFAYADSPLRHGWAVKSGRGLVEVLYDQDLQSRVLAVSSPDADRFAIDYESTTGILAAGKPRLSFRLKATAPFVLFVRVRADDGADYYVQYELGSDAPRVVKGTDGAVYAVHYLSVPDRLRWATVDLDLQEDLHSLTGARLESVRWLKLRGGQYRLGALALHD